MKKLLLIFLFPVLSYGQVQLGQDIDGEATFDFSGFSTSLSADGTVLAVGAPFNDGGGSNSGQVRVFEFSNNDWSQIGADIDGTLSGDSFGRSVSLSANGTILAVGTFNKDDNGTDSGQTRIFENQGGTWVQLGQNIDGVAVQDRSGTSVSLSSDGTMVAIGAPDNNGDGSGINFGQVQIFEYQAPNWVQVGQDIYGEGTEDFSGFSVSISSNGSTVAIGATNNDSASGFFAGQVRVYENQGGTWVQIGQDIDGEAQEDFFGLATVISADGSIVASRSGHNDGNGNQSGSTRVFENQNGTWVQIGQDIDGEAAEDGEFPTRTNLAMSADGSILAIGAHRNDGNGPESGHVRIYQNQGGTWVQVGQDIDGEAAGDQSGYSVSLSTDGTIVAIGARDNGATGPDAGHVRVFDISSFVLSTDDVLSAQFVMYPNPTSEQLLISLSNNSTLEKTTIYNSLGQPVITSSELEIDTTNLSSGTYIVEISTNKGKASKKLIVK